jgi:Flp pilus assembly pilin Flp
MTEKGSGAMEYALLIASIVLVLLLAINSLGQKLSDTLNCLKNQGAESAQSGG